MLSSVILPRISDLKLLIERRLERLKDRLGSRNHTLSSSSSSGPLHVASKSSLTFKLLGATLREPEDLMPTPFRLDGVKSDDTEGRLVIFVSVASSWISGRSL